MKTLDLLQKRLNASLDADGMGVSATTYKAIASAAADVALSVEDRLKSLDSNALLEAKAMARADALAKGLRDYAAHVHYDRPEVSDQEQVKGGLPVWLQK